MNKLSYSERKGLPTKSFAEPKERKYPIPDASHARNALSRVAQHGSSMEKEMVRAEVHRRFPQIGKKKKTA